MRANHKEKIELTKHELELLEMCLRYSINELRGCHNYGCEALSEALITLLSDIRERFVTAYKEGKNNDVPKRF